MPVARIWLYTLATFDAHSGKPPFPGSTRFHGAGGGDVSCCLWRPMMGSAPNGRLGSGDLLDQSMQGDA